MDQGHYQPDEQMISHGEKKMEYVVENYPQQVHPSHYDTTQGSDKGVKEYFNGHRYQTKLADTHQTVHPNDSLHPQVVTLSEPHLVQDSQMTHIDDSHHLLHPTEEDELHTAQAMQQFNSATDEVLEATTAEEVLNSISAAEDVLNGRELPPPSEEDPRKGQKGKRKKTGEEETAKKRVCLALGCEKEITRRNLCPAHSKQKQRNGGKIELKSGEKLATKPGRPNKPFSEQARPYHKLQYFDKKIDEWAGGKAEGNLMLQEYINSSFFEVRLPEHTNAETFEQIGRNVVSFLDQLPEKSPFRKPLIKAIGKDIPISKLEKVMTYGKTTISKSLKLADENNLLLSIRYKPNVRRKRPGKDDEKPELVTDNKEIAHSLTMNGVGVELVSNFNNNLEMSLV